MLVHVKYLEEHLACGEYPTNVSNNNDNNKGDSSLKISMVVLRGKALAWVLPHDTVTLGKPVTLSESQACLTGP